MRELVEKLHTTHQTLGLFTASVVVPACCEALIELFLRRLQTALEGGDTSEVCIVLQLLQLFAQLHLLQQKIRILHRHFQRKLGTAHGQQIAGALRRCFQNLISLVEAGRALQRQALLTLTGIGESIRMNLACQLTVTCRQLFQVDTKARLQVEQGEMAGITHSGPQTLKLSPQPHSPRTLGLLNLKPSLRPSLTKSSSVPSR